MIKGVLRSCLVLMPYQWHKTWSRCTTRCKKMSSALPPHSALRPSCMGLAIICAKTGIKQSLAKEKTREKTSMTQSQVILLHIQ